MKFSNTQPNASSDDTEPEENEDTDPEWYTEQIKRYRTKTILSFMGIAALCALMLAAMFYPVFNRSLIYSGDCSGSDLLELNIPRRVLVAQALKQGELPLWEPKLGNGFSLLAEGQAGTFYPTTLPLYALFSPTTATNLSLLTTMLIAMLGSYWLARLYGLRPLPALFSAVTYGLGGAFIFRLKHLNMVQVIAWLPLNLALVRVYSEYYADKNDTCRMLPRVFYLGAEALVMACQILAGHPHVTYICWLTTYLYALALPYENNQWRRMAGINHMGRWTMLFRLALATIAALVLCAVQLAPTYELVQGSTRSEANSWDDLKKYPFKLQHMVRLVEPYSDGNPADGTYEGAMNIVDNGVFWESTPYVGYIPLLLAILAVAYHGGVLTVYHVRILAGLALLFLLSAFGPQGGVFWLMWKLCPGFALFRFPARLLIPFICILGVLAAIGAEKLGRLLEDKYGQRWSNIALGVLLFFTLAGFWVTNSQYQTYLPCSWEEKPQAWQELEASAQRIYAPTSIRTWQDIALANGWCGHEKALISHLNVLSPDLTAIWGAQCHSDRVLFEGGIELAPYCYLQIWQFNHIFPNIDGRNGRFTIDPQVYIWLRLQNVSHLVSFMPIANANDIPLISEVRVLHSEATGDRDLFIYALRDPLPKVRLISADLSAAQPAMLDFNTPEPEGIMPSLYEKDLLFPAAPGQATLISETRNNLSVATECASESVLFVANNYHRNWHAYLEDGSEVPIIRVDYAYQGVRLPPGKHQVELRYSSPAFSWGWKISLASFLLFCLGLAIPSWRRRLG